MSNSGSGFSSGATLRVAVSLPLLVAVIAELSDGTDDARSLAAALASESPAWYWPRCRPTATPKTVTGDHRRHHRRCRLRRLSDTRGSHGPSACGHTQTPSRPVSGNSGTGGRFARKQINRERYEQALTEF